jgi:hypothetical protein
MRAQGYTEEEIADMLECDRQIDRGADLFPLSAELEQGAKKARRADRTDTPKKAERERKEDIEKRTLINALTATADRYANGNIEIINPEREFLFTWNGKKYKVVLSCPRS